MKSTCARPLQPVFAEMPKRFAPMLDANGVRALISEHFDYGALDLANDIECGHYEWAFDIGAGETRNEFRFFKPAVEQRLRKLLNPKWVVRSFSFDTVLRELFAHRNPRKPWVTTPQVQLAFVCNHALVMELVRAADLDLLPNTSISAGKGNATQITWASITRFLERRKL